MVNEGEGPLREKATLPVGFEPGPRPVSPYRTTPSSTVRKRFTTTLRPSPGTPPSPGGGSTGSSGPGGRRGSLLDRGQGTGVVGGHGGVDDKEIPGGGGRKRRGG